MSIKLKKSNDLEANLLYKSREEYKKVYGFIDDYFQDVIVDNYFENPLWLKTDSNGGSIFVSESFLFELTPKLQNFILVHDFVKKAFEDMDVYYKLALATGKLNKTSSPYSSLRPRQGFIGMHKQYSTYLNGFRNILIADIKNQKNKNKILNFSDFIDYFFRFFSIQEGMFFSRSAFIRSKLSHPFSSGLSISLAIEDYSDDIKKNNIYASDPNFPFFMESCRRFGFVVDRSAPWNIHFDFYSPKALEYMNQFGVKTPEDLIKKRYYKAIYSDISILKKFLEHAYLTYTGDQPTLDLVVDVSSCNAPVVHSTTRETFIEGTGSNNFSEIFWLTLYFKIRLAEEKITLTDNKVDSYALDIKNVLRYGKAYNDTNKLASSLDKIQEILNKERKSIDKKLIKTF